MSSSTGSINWSQVYNTPIGQILEDLNPTVFETLLTQSTNNQITTLQNQEQQDQTLISAWSTLQSDAQSVSADLTTLASSATYNQLMASSSNNNVATAVDQSAQQGTYTITVNALAEPEIDIGSTANMTVTNPNATLTVPGTTSPLTGSFTITVGGQSATVVLPTSGESLNALVSQINNTPGIGVTATAVENSQGDWLIEIQANQTGQAISYADNTSPGPLYYLGLVSSSSTATQSAANILQAASSAEVSFGSTYNASEAIASTSNTLTNLIPGMTVTLLSTGTTTISVTPNVSAMVSSVQQFVSDWNQWVKDTQNLAEAGQVEEVGTGSSASYEFVSNANQVITSPLPLATLNQAAEVLGATTTGSGTYQSLADLGLTFNTNGTLSLNTATLTDALTNDPTQVLNIFQAVQQNLGIGISGVINGFSEGPTSSAGEAITTLNEEVASDKSQIALLNQQMSNEEEQAIIQYGQWVNSVSKDSERYSLLNALFNANSGSSSSGG
ncbi:MAG: flagellar filament capping protein FliD [Firmicutes bacterium]|nr:flagellar filament capping protein FliD [Bacillota bacterium]